MEYSFPGSARNAKKSTSPRVSISPLIATPGRMPVAETRASPWSSLGSGVGAGAGSAMNVQDADIIAMTSVPMTATNNLFLKIIYSLRSRLSCLCVSPPVAIRAARRRVFHSFAFRRAAARPRLSAKSSSRIAAFSRFCAVRLGTRRGSVTQTKVSPSAKTVPAPDERRSARGRFRDFAIRRGLGLGAETPVSGVAPKAAMGASEYAAAWAAMRRARRRQGEVEGNRGMPDCVGRGLDRRPIRTFVGGGGGSDLERLSERGGRLHHLRRVLQKDDSSGCRSTIP